MSDFDIVETEYGKIRGIKKVSALETPYTAFVGVPYARAPVGDLRFKVSNRFMSHSSFVEYLKRLDKNEFVCCHEFSNRIPHQWKNGKTFTMQHRRKLVVMAKISIRRR